MFSSRVPYTTDWLPVSSAQRRAAIGDQSGSGKIIGKLGIGTIGIGTVGTEK